MDSPQQLPHLIVEEPKRSIPALLAIIVFSLMLVAIPVGVYLVGEPQKFFSQASNEEVDSLKTSVELKSDSQNIKAGDEFSVDVELKSDADAINLAYLKLKYDPKFLAVIQIIGDNGQPVINEWLSDGFDNEKGELILAGGVSSPGVLTKPEEKALLIAKVRFVAIQKGDTTISFDEANLFKNSDNTNILKNRNNLSISVSDGGSIEELTQKLNTLQTLIRKEDSAQENIQVTTPQTGDVYYFFSPIDITWGGNFDLVSAITLYLNNQPFADLATNVPNQGRFTWNPAGVLPVHYITPNNSFQIEISGLTKDRVELKSAINPSFGLTTRQDGRLVSTASGQIRQYSQASITDASRILSRFGTTLETDDQLDLNGDRVINGLDLALLRNALLVRDLIID